MFVWTIILDDLYVLCARTCHTLAHCFHADCTWLNKRAQNLDVFSDVFCPYASSICPSLLGLVWSQLSTRVSKFLGIQPKVDPLNIYITSNNRGLLMGVHGLPLSSPIPFGAPILAGLARACARPGSEVTAGNRRQGGQRGRDHQRRLCCGRIELRDGSWWLKYVEICWTMLKWIKWMRFLQRVRTFLQDNFWPCSVLFVGMAGPCRWISGRDGCLPSSGGPGVVSTRDASWNCLCLEMSPKRGFKRAQCQNSRVGKYDEICMFPFVWGEEGRPLQLLWIEDLA